MNKPGPRLAKLIENGDAYIQETTVYGIASDGVVVILGFADDPQEVENYLKECPTPEDW